jgi:uncharacterized membrane protein HdeD (DUF308 family)
MFRMLFAAILSLGCIGILSMLGSVVYNDPVESLFVVGSVIGLFATVLGGIAFLQYLENRKKANAKKPDSLFMQKYKAHKAKICPMVEYE